MSNERTHVTISQSWKTVLSDVMGSKSSIAIPMSKGVFAPDVHSGPRRPALLNTADLITLFFYQRCFDLGMNLSDFETDGTVRPADLRGVYVWRGPGSVGTENYDGVYELRSSRVRLWFDTRGLQPEVIDSVFPEKPGKTEKLGPGRVIQRLLEAHNFNLVCIVRTLIPKAEEHQYHVFFVPFDTALLDANDPYQMRWHPGSLYWIATGGNVYSHPANDQGYVHQYELGFTQIPINLIHQRVQRSLKTVE